MLEGFRKFEVLQGSAFMSISNTGVNFNKNVLIKMQRCSFITILIDDKEKRVAIQACDEAEEYSFPFVKETTVVEKGVRIHNRELENTLARLCNLDLLQATFRVDGEYLPEEKAMVFNLSVGRVFKKRVKK